MTKTSLTNPATIALLSVAILSTNPPAEADCVVVNTNREPNMVASFVVNPGGTLSPAAGSPFATGGNGGSTLAVGNLGISAAARRLYAANSSGTVSGFDVDPDTCVLTPIPGTPWTAGTNPTGVVVDPAGDFLYVANRSSDDISVFAIAGDGSLSEIAGSPTGTPMSPFDVEFSGTGDRLFVSHPFDDSVGVYDVAADGSFSPVAGSPFAADGHGLALNPASTRLYVADNESDTIIGFSIDGAGALTPLAGSPFAAGAFVLEVLVDGNDTFTYAANNATNTISSYSIDGAGDLTPIAGSPFASDSNGPAGMVLSPDGAVLYVANGGANGGLIGGSSFVSMYAVAGDGSIAPLAAPILIDGIGRAASIGYLSGDAGPPPFDVEVPTLGSSGLLALVFLLGAIGVVASRRFG